jgi:hypothetical protein
MTKVVLERTDLFLRLLQEFLGLAKLVLASDSSAGIISHTCVCDVVCV